MSPIERLQLDLEARLNSLEYFVDINAAAVSPGSDGSYSFILTQRDQAMAGELAKAGKYGASVFVGEPYFDNEKPNLPGVAGRILVPIEVIEHRVANMIPVSGTLKSADEIALRIARTLSNYRTQSGQQSDTDYTVGSCFTEKAAISPDENPDGPVKRRTVLIHAPFAQNKPSACIDVQMGLAGQTVTLSTGTPGATIYYTRNGNSPWSGATGAVAYTVPFLAASGETVRAVAFKSGLEPSNVTTRVIP